MLNMDLQHSDINYKNELAYIIQHLYHVILHYIIPNIYKIKFDITHLSKPSLKTKLYIYIYYVKLIFI